VEQRQPLVEEVRLLVEVVGPSVEQGHQPPQAREKKNGGVVWHLLKDHLSRSQLLNIGMRRSGLRETRRHSTCKQEIQVAGRGPETVNPEGKASLIKNNVVRQDDAPGRQIKTTLPLVRGGIAEKDTIC
jgi:hypothetical protein